MLFLCSRTNDKDQKVSTVVRHQLTRILQALAFKEIPDGRDCKALLDFCADQVCDDLDKLFLIKELYEQTLIYARYGAKAAK
jgi:hypothetical protein